MLRNIGGLFLAVVFSGLVTASAADLPKPEAVVREFGEQVRTSKTFRVKVSTVMRMEMEGMKQEYTTRSVLSVVRPDKVASVLEYGVMGATVVSDGKKLTRYMPMAARYSEEEAPADLGEAVSDSGPGMLMGGSFPMMAAILSDDPAKAMLDGTSGGEYMGSRKLDGVECHVVRFKQEGFDWEAWFEAGGRKLLRKVIPDVSRMMKGGGADAMPGMKDMKYEMSFDLAGWELGAEIQASTFTFTPPAGARRTDDLFGTGGGDDGEKNQLVGKPAPDFSIAMVEKGSFKLSEKKGKVVILDFWASWCGPCRKGLPVVTKLAEELASRGVVFCGVNQQEDADTIREFLKEEKLKFPVGMDTDGKVGESYGVRGIPMTVVIDPLGAVRAVHTGFSQTLETELRAEIEAALGAKKSD